MKNVEFYIGLDVHKKTTTCVIRDKYGQIIEDIKCASLYKELHTAIEPYLFSSVIGLEASTSYYHIYREFKENRYDILVANTLQLRQLLAKNDRLDAKRLAEMLRLGSFPLSYIPDEKIQRLRSLIHLRHKFRDERIRIKNQIHAFLDKNGVKIPRKPFCKKWVSTFEQYLKEVDSIELRYAYEHYLSVKERVNQITNESIAYAKKHWIKEFNLLISIVGFGPVLTTYIIAEVHPIQRFDTNRNLRRYAGVVPATKESDDVRIKGHLPKTASRPLLRWALTEASNTIARTKTGIAKYYKKKKRQLKNTGMAKIAVASSLSDIIFKVLSTGKPYHGS
jgi:transposase